MSGDLVNLDDWGRGMCCGLHIGIRDYAPDCDHDFWFIEGDGGYGSVDAEYGYYPEDQLARRVILARPDRV